MSGPTPLPSVPPKGVLRGCLALALSAWLFIGACAVWSGTSDGRERDRVVHAVEEGARPERFPTPDADEFKHSLAVRDAFEGTLDVPDRYEVEMIGGTRQLGVSQPKRFAWVERYAKDDGRLLGAGLVRMWEWNGEYRIIGYYPTDRLTKAIEQGLPTDVEAFARRKLAEFP